MDNNTNLTASQVKALEALVSTKNQKEAAAAAGVSDRTIRQYMSDPLFRSELVRVQSERLTAVSVRATSAMDTALDALEDVAQHGNDAARISAATVLLRCGRDMLEAYSIDTRMTQLETQLENLIHSR